MTARTSGWRISVVVLAFGSSALLYLLLLRTFGALPEVRASRTDISKSHALIEANQTTLEQQGRKLTALKAKIDSLAADYAHWKATRPND